MAISDLLCKGPQQLSPLKRPASSTAATKPWQVSRVLCLQMPRHQGLCALPSLSMPEPGSALAASPGLCSCTDPRCQPGPLQLLPTAMCALGKTSVTGLYCHAHTRAAILQPWEYMRMTRAPQLLVGPALALSPVSGLPFLGSFQPAPSAVNFHLTGLSLVTGFHCCAPTVRACSWRHAC